MPLPAVVPPVRHSMQKQWGTQPLGRYAQYAQRVRCAHSMSAQCTVCTVQNTLTGQRCPSARPGSRGTSARASSVPPSRDREPTNGSPTPARPLAGGWGAPGTPSPLWGTVPCTRPTPTHTPGLAGGAPSPAGPRTAAPWAVGGPAGMTQAAGGQEGGSKRGRSP